MPTTTFRGTIVSTLSVPSANLRDGSSSTPSLTFANKPRSGMYYNTNTIGFSALGSGVLAISSSLVAVTGTLTAGNLVGNGSYLTGLPKARISNVLVTDSTWANILQTSAVSNTGGHCVINGTGFVGNVSVLIGPSIAPTLASVTSTQIRATVPPMPNGTYPVWVFTDDSQAFKMSAISASPLPVWTTAATLANVLKTVEFSQTLVATESLGSNVVFQLASGSSLPANVSLTSTGVLAGNILEDSGNSTTYSFTVNATDEQYQQIPRTFGLTALRAFAATGGTVTDDGTYKFHTFTTSGTFTVTLNPTAASVEILVVGGGGGGGGGVGGGGGAGEFRADTFTLSPGTYAVTVGAGGTAGSGSDGTFAGNGGDSVFGALVTSKGGGGGGSTYAAGRAGGSGGGGGGSNGATNGGASTASGGGFGYAGGAGDGSAAGGGGGGAGGVGTNSRTNEVNGGIGRQWVNGVYYAGGGSGAKNVTAGGTGGLGGGGNSSTAGTPNTGGGGGGANNIPTYDVGRIGGSGVVIIAYRL